MLTIREYPKDCYNIYNEDSGESITRLNLCELDNIKRMITGIHVSKMPEPQIHPIIKDILKQHIRGVN